MGTSLGGPDRRTKGIRIQRLSALSERTFREPADNGVSKQSLRTKLESVAIAAVVIVAVVAEKG